MKIQIKKKLVFIDDGAVNGKQDVYPVGEIKFSKEPILVQYNFDPKFPVGKGTLVKGEKASHEIYADITLYPRSTTDIDKVLDNFTGLFPSIRGCLFPDKDNKKKVGGLEIQSIGLCNKSNSDIRIQPLLKKDLEIINDKEPA